ncbi:hypothetical protein [Solibacillus merdavium]|uniref:Uncharacterized protein n=1 Tax=Solibacillus merdavium TaxID=2762218 RepID=A0ABR8XPX0_9BACL|nr:hypothetical protein [Solibacillus merdavium]MBD8033993.1 hypothetical protein [Solibacillus merdavium]
MLLKLNGYLIRYSFISKSNLSAEIVEEMQSDLIRFNTILAENDFNDKDEFGSWTKQNYLKKLEMLFQKSIKQTGKFRGTIHDRQFKRPFGKVKEVMKLDNKKGLLLFCSIVFLSISIIIASKFISDALNNVGLGLEASKSNTTSIENFELILNDGWMYLYETNSGQIWKKADNDNPDSEWELVKHYTE